MQNYLRTKFISLELTHFVTGSVMLFVVFPAFHHLFTPPKNPFLVVVGGFFTTLSVGEVNTDTS